MVGSVLSLFFFGDRGGLGQETRVCLSPIVALNYVAEVGLLIFIFSPVWPQTPEYWNYRWLL